MLQMLLDNVSVLSRHCQALASRSFPMFSGLGQGLVGGWMDGCVSELVMGGWMDG